MKTLRSHRLLLGFICFAVGGRLEANDEAFLIGMRDSSNCDFWVPWSVLPSKVSWFPGNESFPLELGAETRRAITFLAERTATSNRMDLGNITIKRQSISHQDIESHGKSVMDFTNHWFAVFSFIVQPNTAEALRLRQKHVVMLLDGTYAIEKPSSIGVSNSNPKAIISTRAAEGSVKRHEQAPPINPYDLLQSSDLRISQVQWDPLIQSFPRDLAKDAAHFEQYALSSVGRVSQDIVLQDIAIERYFPNEALKASGKEIGQNRHHWLIVFRYYDAAAVYVLLDGSILAVIPLKS